MGGAIEKRHLVGPATQQPSDAVVAGADSVLCCRGRLVTNDPGLQPQMCGHRVQRGLRQQRSACIVQMQPVRATGRLRPQSFDIHVPHPRRR
jgi:hypothetical protein